MSWTDTQRSSTPQKSHLQTLQVMNAYTSTSWLVMHFSARASADFARGTVHAERHERIVLSHEMYQNSPSQQLSSTMQTPTQSVQLDLSFPLDSQSLTKPYTKLGPLAVLII